MTSHRTASDFRRGGGRRNRRHRRRDHAQTRRLSRRHRLRTELRARRCVADEHLSGGGVRRPVALLRVLLRTEPRLVVSLCPAGRNQGVPRECGPRPRSRGIVPVQRRGALGDVGRPRTLGAGHRQRATHRGRVDHRLWAVDQPEIPRHRWARSDSRGPRFTPGSGATTSTWPASAWLSSVRAAAPLRSSPPSSRIVATVDVYQRSPGWTMPRMNYDYSERAKRRFRRHPWLQRLDRRVVQTIMEIGAIAMTRRQWMLGPLKPWDAGGFSKAIKRPRICGRRDAAGSSPVASA